MSPDQIISSTISFALNAGLVLAAMLLLLMVVSSSGCMVFIRNNEVGIVEKLWSLQGSVTEGIIALKNEAGYQPDVLRGGFHFFVPFTYRVRRMPLVTIAQGQIGYVFARDGIALSPYQTLASNTQANIFEDVRHFLTHGGQRGPQRKILREGVYPINLAQFVVLTKDEIFAVALSGSDNAMLEKMTGAIAERDGYMPVVIKNKDDMIGVVTVHDGPSLPEGEIIAPTVGSDVSSPHFHNNYQDPESFLLSGGYRGRQHQVLVDGTYFLNRLFATVEMIPKTIIDVGTVGVVVSYSGARSEDISGDDYRHGELVKNGYRGVWVDPILPGKYAFNTYAAAIHIVPTTNFVLKWTKDSIGPHKLDENLSDISLITRDAFEPNLPLSVVVHIDYQKAPLVIQRFGDIRRLVEQTLDPMVSAYFKNIGQTKTLIELLQERSSIQKLASEEMRGKFLEYSLDLQEVLIGTPKSPANQTAIETMLDQLRNRQIAVEQVATYELQEAAAVQQRSLREKQAIADQQINITASVLSVQVRENEGKAALAKARQEAESIKITADANANRVRAEGEGEAAKIRLVGEADASRTRAIGLAQAEATEKQVEAYGGPQYQLNSQVLMRFAEAIEKGRLPLVPNVMVTGGSGDKAGSGSNLVELLLGMLVAERTQPGNMPEMPGKTSGPT